MRTISTVSICTDNKKMVPDMIKCAEESQCLKLSLPSEQWQALSRHPQCTSGCSPRLSTFSEYVLRYLSRLRQRNYHSLLSDDWIGLHTFAQLWPNKIEHRDCAHWHKHEIDLNSVAKEFASENENIETFFGHYWRVTVVHRMQQIVRFSSHVM